MWQIKNQEQDNENDNIAVKILFSRSAPDDEGERENIV